MWMQHEYLWSQGGLLVGFSTTDSSTQQSSSVLLMILFFFFPFFQDGELVLEHSTPCWTCWHLQKKTKKPPTLFVLLSPFYCFFQVWLKLLLSVSSHDEPSKMITNRGIVPHFIPSSELEAHTNHKRSIKRGEIQSYIYYYWSVRYREKTFSSYPIAHRRRQIHIDREPDPGETLLHILKK